MEVQASSNGRELTLDPIRTHTLRIEAREVESTLPAGLRQPWVDGETGEHTFTITTGAGLGSPWVVMNVRKDGSDVYQGVLNVEDILRAWLSEIGI